MIITKNLIFRKTKTVFIKQTIKTTYTINIIARNAETNAYVAAITQKITTTSINKPDLTGFNTEEQDKNGNKLPVTYYVEYDENGEKPRIGEKIKNDGSN